MSQRRPLIAVAGGIAPKHPAGGWPHQDTLVMPASIIRAVQRAGGQEAVLQPRTLDEVGADKMLSRFDGLLLIGGPDVDPAKYGQAAHPTVYGVAVERDEFENALIQVAIERRLPVLAICRGIQVVNVALGGTLDQHISGRPGLLEHGIPGTGGTLNTVELAVGSRTAQAMKTSTVTASCHHHQAIDLLGTELTITGRAADGIIEAIEYCEGWIVGVQWHPEDTAHQDVAQQGLFDALVEHAATLTPV